MEIISTHKRSPWRVCPLSCLAMDGTDNEIYKFVSARLTQFLPHGINATALPSSELIWNTCIYVMWHVSPTGGASWQMRRKNGCRPKKTIFFAPFAGPLGWSPKYGMQLSGTDLRTCAKFQPNQFSSFGRDATPKQTGRQTVTRTANLTKNQIIQR